MPANLPIQLNGDGYEPMELDAVEPDDHPSELPIIDEVNLDLTTYASHYQGLVRIYRLEFIADHCRSLREEALTMALDYIKGHTCNVRDYVRLSKKLQETSLERRLPQASSSKAPSTSTSQDHMHSTWPSNEAESSSGQNPTTSNGTGTHPDNAWIDTKTKQAALKYEKLESDLKNYKAIYVKENLRRAQDDLGQHYLDCGDLEGALNAYTKSRDFASTNRSPFNQYLNMIRVAILLKRWTAVSNYVLRAWSQPVGDQSTMNAVNEMNCAIALSELHQRNYTKAARYFLAINVEYFSPNAGILAPIDVAVYGSICALATYDREKLAGGVINSPSFKQFAELDSQVREAVAKFYESKYDSCLAILQEIKNNLLLDMYLAPHVDRLYRLIRNKAIVQYFEPYSSACMSRMANSFRTSLPELEQEVIQLIYEGQIKARIDSHQRILFAKHVDPRIETFENAISLGKQWQRQTKALITRTAILNASLEVDSNTIDLVDQRADQRADHR